MKNIQRAICVKLHKGEMLQLASQRMLINGAATCSNHQIFHAILGGIGLQTMQMSGNDRRHFGLDQQRMNALEPLHAVVAPQRAMHQNDDGFGARHRAIK